MGCGNRRAVILLEMVGKTRSGQVFLVGAGEGKSASIVVWLAVSFALIVCETVFEGGVLSVEEQCAA